MYNTSFSTHCVDFHILFSNILFNAIEDGINRQSWKKETFAFAEEWDEKNNRYAGLLAGKIVSIKDANKGILVKAEPAVNQIEIEKEESSDENKQTIITPHDIPSNETVGTPGESKEEITNKKAYRRFHGSAGLNPVRIGRDAGRIAQEVLQHLIALPGAELEVNLEIQVNLPNGANDKIVRDVTENCRTLKFDTFGFEEE